MTTMYENADVIPSSNNDKCRHCKGNVSAQQTRTITLSNRTSLLLLVLGVSLVFFLGGLCVLRVDYSQRLQEQLSSCLEIRKPFNKPCKDGWRAYDGKCYYFSSKTQTWFVSEDICVALEAHLVTINSKKEQAFLISEISESYWIGLNDLDTEGHWVWVNNQTLTETGVEFWYKRESVPSEPDNWKLQDLSGENCACLGHWDGGLNDWVDSSCTAKSKFICEKKY